VSMAGAERIRDGIEEMFDILNLTICVYIKIGVKN
jgi:hypothetical protein